MLRQGTQPDIVTYSVLISTREKGEEPRVAVNVCEVMLRQGIKHEAGNYNVWVGACEKGEQPNAITHGAMTSAYEKGELPEQALQHTQTTHCTHNTTNHTTRSTSSISNMDRTSANNRNITGATQHSSNITIINITIITTTVRVKFHKSKIPFSELGIHNIPCSIARAVYVRTKHGTSTNFPRRTFCQTYGGGWGFEVKVPR